MTSQDRTPHVDFIPKGDAQFPAPETMRDATSNVVHGSIWPSGVDRDIPIPAGTAMTVRDVFSALEFSNTGSCMPMVNGVETSLEQVVHPGDEVSAILRIKGNA